MQDLCIKAEIFKTSWGIGHPDPFYSHFYWAVDGRYYQSWKYGFWILINFSFLMTIGYLNLLKGLKIQHIHIILQTLRVPSYKTYLYI